MSMMWGRIIGIILLVVLSPVSLISAQTEEELIVTPTPVDYQLPYPGLLPDHPFYFLKQARDDLFGFFASNALKKAEYNLHQADKRIEASIMLLDKKNNADLAAMTFDQSITYFEEAIEKTIAAKQQGMETTDIVKQLTLANLKHQEVTKNLVKKNPEKFDKKAKKLEELGKKVKTFQKQK